MAKTPDLLLADSAIRAKLLDPIASRIAWVSPAGDEVRVPPGRQVAHYLPAQRHTTTH